MYHKSQTYKMFLSNKLSLLVNNCNMVFRNVNLRDLNKSDPWNTNTKQNHSLGHIQESLGYYKKELAYLIILRKNYETSKLSPKNATFLFNVLKSKMSNSGFREGPYLMFICYAFCVCFQRYKTWRFGSSFSPKKWRFLVTFC